MNQTDGQKKKNKLEIPLFWFFILHLTLILNSTTGVVSKFAGRAKFMSIRFILLYFLLMMICVSFAILWQQVLKRMSLTFAFMNKPITVIYSLLWGKFLFKEQVTPKMIIGAIVIMIGIVIGVSNDG